MKKEIEIKNMIGILEKITCEDEEYPSGFILGLKWVLDIN